MCTVTKLYTFSEAYWTLEVTFTCFQAEPVRHKNPGPCSEMIGNFKVAAAKSGTQS